ncbi:MAG: hypothetical protein OXH34_01705 [Bacteroidetes bacterium]|nr:hypothetical protein [Bacteroidota bacterium]
MSRRYELDGFARAMLSVIPITGGIFAVILLLGVFGCWQGEETSMDTEEVYEEVLPDSILREHEIMRRRIEFCREHVRRVDFHSGCLAGYLAQPID